MPHDVVVEVGPVERTSAMNCFYIRAPDGNLIELSGKLDEAENLVR